MAEYIEREAVVNGIWKALYSYEDEMEAMFEADPELDVSQWFFHRIFVQTMSSIDLQVILDVPAVDVRPVVRCKDCKHDGLLSCPLVMIEKQHMVFINHDPLWFCANGERKGEP